MPLPIIPLRKSLLFAHAEQCLLYDIDVTLNMYCAYNDIDTETREELRTLFRQDGKINRLKLWRWADRED